jgi:hypothetical protein
MPPGVQARAIDAVPRTAVIVGAARSCGPGWNSVPASVLIWAQSSIR